MITQVGKKSDGKGWYPVTGNRHPIGSVKRIRTKWAARTPDPQTRTGFATRGEAVAFLVSESASRIPAEPTPKATTWTDVSHEGTMVGQVICLSNGTWRSRTLSGKEKINIASYAEAKASLL